MNLSVEPVVKLRSKQEQSNNWVRERAAVQAAFIIHKRAFVHTHTKVEQEDNSPVLTPQM